MTEDSGDESPEDRDYRRLLGKSAKKGAVGVGGTPLRTTPLSSVKVPLDGLSDGEEGGSRSPLNIPPGAPGYIEPGSTPDRSVLDKIREPPAHGLLFVPDRGQLAHQIASSSSD